MMRVDRVVVTFLYLCSAAAAGVGIWFAVQFLRFMFAC